MMPSWTAELAVGEVLAWLAGAAVVIAAVMKLIKAVKPLADLLQAVREFLSEWNGKPAALDDSGAVKAPAEPGMLARVGALEKHMTAVRHQVKNDHNTNLRDDVDRVISQVGAVVGKLDQHITIAKESDVQQAEIATKVARLDARYGHSRARTN